MRDCYIKSDEVVNGGLEDLNESINNNYTGYSRKVSHESRSIFGSSVINTIINTSKLCNSNY